VIHDWGSALGFDWARRHPEAVRAIAYMEAITQPLESWESWPEDYRELFQGFRSERGEELILENNTFVESVLPGAILRELTDEEMAEYRRPYRQPGESRRPTLTWPRQIPIEGRPEDVCEIVDQYGRWLAAAPGIPKLFINGAPGAILRDQQRDFCRSWPDQTEITVPGIHFLQEDSGTEIGNAIADWLPAPRRHRS
jgi:haloalkane dehalogenase